MKKVLLVGLTTLSFVLAPTLSFARDHYRGDRYRSDHYRGDRHYKHRGNDDAIIAGVAGLAIGAIIGSAITKNREDRYYGPPQPAYRGPPPPYRDDSYRDDGYYNEGYNDGGYNSQCFRREVVWDPRLRRNVEVTHPIPC